MKFISWNVNGLRACCGKGFEDSFRALDADFFCLQETKMQEGQTAIFSRHEPLSVTYGLGLEEHDTEGRVITLEMPEFYLVTVYTPNSQDELRRLDYRMTWEDEFRAYLLRLDAVKPVIVCGDLNVAHKEIDLKNPKTNRMNAGFTKAREKNAGWRIDYFLVSNRLQPKLLGAAIHNEVFGSDHCPVELVLDI